MPPVDILHLHHAVWVNQSRVDSTSGGPERFFAMGEEKTRLALPDGYGYKYHTSDRWLLNYMIHDLVTKPFDVRITYDITFIPATKAGPMTSVIPIWMDVQNGSDLSGLRRASGQRDQRPVHLPGPHEQSVPRAAQEQVHDADKRHVRVGRRSPSPRRVVGRPLRRSRARAPRMCSDPNTKYFEAAGPVSWDVTLGVTRANWRLHVKAGDTLRLTTTYDSSTRSWYEAMGIMVAWFAPNQTKGIDPFAVTPAEHAGSLHARPPQGEQQSRWRGRPHSPRSVDAGERPDRERDRDQLLRLRPGRPRPRDRGPDRPPRAVDPVHEYRHALGRATGLGTRSPTARCRATSPPVSRSRPPTRRSSSTPGNSATTVRRPRVA